MIDDSTARGVRPENTTAAVPRKVFCIHSYAGESGPPCGWRGVTTDVEREPASGMRRCPRCGRATLMDIPAPDAP